jgi:hypothetical protein
MPEPVLWRAEPEHVLAVEATLEHERVTVTREDQDPARAWCRIVTEVDGAPPRVIEFPVEGRSADGLFRELAAPEIREALGEVDSIDGTRSIRVTLDGEPPRILHVAADESDDTTRRVLDPATGKAFLVDDRWWRTLAAAQRLLPLRKLVDRRGLERVTIHARGRAWPLVLKDGAWIPDDPSVDRSRAEAIVLAALRLRPGAFDRTVDPSTLREVARFEFTGGDAPQTLELFAAPDDTWWLRSSRASGLAKTHHLHAIDLATELDAL